MKKFNTRAILDAPTKRFLGKMKSLREDAGLSLGALAVAVGVSKTTVLRMETKDELPFIHNLLKVASALKYDISDSVNYKYYHGEVSPEKIEDMLALSVLMGGGDDDKAV